ncbi:hypothetical protein [Flavihumibacter solisilvae]|uniref:Uncharacterized protein n=1 Tax=Flavihumibacter solisilvae TaxID=1349421 RepID=A0A0C1I9I6_9BACT|nr:hypothetical protein [Flavihumibacter solisilvae]KIC90675.1 hypothetical protein OI18_23240 [Flavihumibacter solisilvae]
MNIYFSENITYTVNDTFENVQADINSIVNRPWHDFSENITGNIDEENKFTFTHKWSFAVIKWIEKNPAYLSGKLSIDKNKTVITTTVRPNSIFVIFFYLLTILFLFEVIGIETFIEGPKYYKLLFFPLFNLIIFGIMKGFMTGLQNRFERILKLERA